MSLTAWRGVGRVRSMMLPAMMLVFLSATAMGQALPTATRTLQLSVYGEASRINNDYTPDQSYGFIVGGDVTRIFHKIEASIDPSFGRISDYLVTQDYFLANLKLGKSFGRQDRFHPFAMAGIGHGSMHLGHPLLTTQTSTVYDVAGGLDYDLSSKFALKGEYQYQFWDFGYYSDGLNPRGFSAGFVYHINSVHLRRRR